MRSLSRMTLVLGTIATKCIKVNGHSYGKALKMATGFVQYRSLMHPLDLGMGGGGGGKVGHDGLNLPAFCVLGRTLNFSLLFLMLVFMKRDY